MKEKIIKLKHPIPASIAGTEEDITELKFGRLKAKHLKYFPKELLDGSDNGLVNFEPAEVLPIIAGLTGLSEKVIGELDLEDDFHTVMDGFADFFEQTQFHQEPATGKK
jgi:hypothetical protein